MFLPYLLPTFMLLSDRLVRRFRSRSGSRSIGVAQSKETSSDSRGSIGLGKFGLTAFLSVEIEGNTSWFHSIVQTATFVDTTSPLRIKVNGCRGGSQGSFERYTGLAEPSGLVREVQVAAFRLSGEDGDSEGSNSRCFVGIIVAVSRRPISGVNGIEHQIGDGEGSGSGRAVHVGKACSRSLSGIGIEATLGLRCKGVSTWWGGSGDAHTIGPCFGPIREPLDVINRGGRR
mmetsp:Transcript_7592/g.16600  ORF Transcript_7592/g.16600 Transcript_7592/m.16600 type:complete len:231 (+) Transcript_7592:128-820(+)